MTAARTRPTRTSSSLMSSDGGDSSRKAQPVGSRLGEKPVVTLVNAGLNFNQPIVTVTDMGRIAQRQELLHDVIFKRFHEPNRPTPLEQISSAGENARLVSLDVAFDEIWLRH